LQHLSFLAAAIVFWWSVFNHRGAVGGQGAAVLALFATMLYSGVLGALLAVSPTLWYGWYDHPGPLSPLEDQELAGLIMWVPGGTSYVVAALSLMADWLRRSERETQRWEREILPR
jgi:putative membrane protein